MTKANPKALKMLEQKLGGIVSKPGSYEDTFAALAALENDGWAELLIRLPVDYKIP